MSAEDMVEQSTSLLSVLFERFLDADRISDRLGSRREEISPSFLKVKILWEGAGPPSRASPRAKCVTTSDHSSRTTPRKTIVSYYIPDSKILRGYK